MKFIPYILGMTLILASCSTSRNLSSTMEDDIYYVPGQKPLVVQEVENMTGEKIDLPQEGSKAYADESYSRSSGSSIAPPTFKSDKQAVINRETGNLDYVSTGELAAEAQQRLSDPNSGSGTIYENTGYWVGGYKGNESDLPEIQRIIDMYPEGFAYFGNGSEIAMNLSFDPDWNVYTSDGRYWWFPSSSNIDLYSSLLFGTYPKHIWTVIWNDPQFDSWAFNNSFNSGFNLGLSIGWGGPNWSLGFGWNNGWYRPWYNGWYGWYDPWWSYPGPGWYPGWHHHWHDHPWWGSGHYPNRPSDRPFRPSVRPNYNGIAGRPGSSVRPGSNVRPGTSSRPGTTVRPNTSTLVRPGSTVRPNTTVRPGNTVRPGISTRPNSTIRPGTTTRPGTTVRPNSTIRPGNTVRPNSSYSRPANTTRPSSVTRPNSQYSRPVTRPSSSSTRNSNVKNYSRPQSSYRPTYNNNTTRYKSGSTSRSTYTPSRSSGTSRPAAPVRSAPNRSGRR